MNFDDLETIRLDPRRAPKPTTDRPSIAELEEMVSDGVCDATDGCRVEPDGICEHGHVSWLLYLGFV